MHTNFLVDYPRLVAPNTKGSPQTSVRSILRGCDVIFLVPCYRCWCTAPQYVGGIHLASQPAASLPAQFADWAAGAEHGLILFSLGYTGWVRYLCAVALSFLTRFEPRDVPQRVVSAFMFAFSQLPQRVIMR